MVRISVVTVASLRAEHVTARHAIGVWVGRSVGRDDGRGSRTGPGARGTSTLHPTLGPIDDPVFGGGGAVVVGVATVRRRRRTGWHPRRAGRRP